LEFKVASDEAGRLHSQLVLGDIEGDTTLRNLSQALLPMITRLLSVSLSGKSDPLTLLQRLKDTGMRLQPGESLEDMIERQKNRAVFREFRNKFEPLAPEFFEVMLNVRDARMVSALRNECKGPRVVGVVGLAHLDGIERRWRELQARELGASSATAALEREEAA
jgi:pheromone shutdown protein TraB